MNKAAYKSFCSGKTKPLNIVCRDIKDKTFSVDLIKCRTNALWFNVPWSVFCPYDNITEFDGNIKQWSYVEKEVRGDFLKHLPYTGNGWYHISLVTWCLDAGILQTKHIKFSFEPTVILPHDYMKKRSTP